MINAIWRLSATVECPGAPDSGYGLPVAKGTTQKAGRVNMQGQCVCTQELQTANTGSSWCLLHNLPLSAAVAISLRNKPKRLLLNGVQ